MAFFKFNPLPLVPLLLLFLAASEFVPHADAATYIVGDAIGWTIPQGGAAAYATWASAHTFKVGDILVFNFTTGEHDVARVRQGAYDGCSSDGANLITVGPANISLDSTGPDYFICTFGPHCSLGQKLAINVSAATSPPSPSPRPSTPGAPTMPPSTTPVAPTLPPSTTPVAPTLPPSLPPSIASPPTPPPKVGPSGRPATSPSPGGSTGGPPAPPPGSGPTSGPGGAGAGAGGGAPGPSSGGPPPSSATTSTMTSGSVIALVSISIIFHRALVM